MTLRKKVPTMVLGRTFGLFSIWFCSSLQIVKVHRASGDKPNNWKNVQHNTQYVDTKYTDRSTAPWIQSLSWALPVCTNCWKTMAVNYKRYSSIPDAIQILKPRRSTLNSSALILSCCDVFLSKEILKSYIQENADWFMHRATKFIQYHLFLGSPHVNAFDPISWHCNIMYVLISIIYY